MMLIDNARSLLRRVWSTIPPIYAGTGIRSLLRFLRPYRWHATGLVVLGIMASLFEAVGVSLIIPVLQSLSSQASGTDLETGNYFIDLLSRPFADIPAKERLPIIVAVMLGLIILKNVLTYTLASFTSWLQIHLEQDLRLAVFDQIMRVGYSFITERSIGDLMHQLGETGRTGLALQGIIQILSGLLLIMAYGVLLLLISWPLTLAAVTFLLFLSWILRWVSRSARDLGKDISLASSLLAQVSVECLEAMRLVRAFGREPFERHRYRQRVVEKNALILRSAYLNNLIVPMAEVLSVIFLGLFLLLAANLIISQGSLILPLLLTFLLVLYRLLPRVAFLNSIRVRTTVNLAGADTVARILDVRDKPYVVSGSRTFRLLKNGIRFEHVTFAYKPNGGPVLQDISLEFPAGRTTALVGVSGVGKSTLVDLVLRFYDPNCGRIIVDGVDLRELVLSQWRATIGIVSQDTFVFNTTVRENIVYGKLDATKDEIIQAARQAYAHEFIMAMTDGYNTLVGDRGVRLSAGQRQRVAIARAILRNPQILILDEATSALDSESEWQVQQALYELSAHRTVLVIAHRLSTLAHADQIIVLREGKVVELGKHAELLALRGCYYAFWCLQSGEPEILERRALLKAGS